ncbi:hypothetical protein BGW37DRAFT_516263 [Umbelopsis sp. PMI_123]|nr:hypothetical protein BGW37DRAFT_516263 [Umbelopsis sp. PMI_123]
MSQLQPRRSLKPIVNPRLWNRTPITTADAIAGELVQMHEHVLNERDQLMYEKQEMETKCHKLETQNMSDQQKLSDLERLVKVLTTDNDQLRSEIAELREENASLHKVDSTPVARHSYLDEDDSYNFIVDAYNRRSIHDGISNQHDNHEYEQAVQMAVALSARESAIHKREVHHLSLIVENQDTLIRKLEEKLEEKSANQRIIKPKRSSSNLLQLEDMERDLRRESMQALYQKNQLLASMVGNENEGYSSLQVYTSLPSSTAIPTPTSKADHSTATSRRTSAASTLSSRMNRSIPPATPPPREPLPPLPLRESYTSSSARTSSSSVQSFSISSPTTLSSSEWEKSGSSLNNYQADLHSNTSKGEGDTHPEVTRNRSGFWRGLRSKMVNKH